MLSYFELVCLILFLEDNSERKCVGDQGPILVIYYDY